MNFSELNLTPELQQGLDKLGYTQPTEIQAGAIPIVMRGSDLFARAKTGSGKTLAFLLPILHQLDHSERDIQALVLSPTRELALQIEKDLKAVDRKTRSITIYGGVGMGPQVDALDHGVHIVVATPGRILDHLERGTIDLSRVKYLVLDEADRMLDMGFIDDVERIISQTSRDRQTLMFSATMPPEIKTLADRHMKNPETLLLQQDEITVSAIKQEFYGMDRREKFNTLVKMLRDRNVVKGIIFTNTKSWAETMTRMLFRRGFRVYEIHAGLSQNKRQQVIDDFKAGRFNLLVATDVAARGLHIDGVTHVFNYDLPRNAKDYVHRIGRTGRAGADGEAVSFMTNEDSEFLRGIEREIQMSVDVQTLSGGTFMPKAVPPSARQMADVSGAWDKFD